MAEPLEGLTCPVCGECRCGDCDLTGPVCSQCGTDQPAILCYNAIDIVQCVARWHTEDERTQRLGQYLINEMAPEVKNPKIFYEEDAGKALKMFMMLYMKDYSVEEKEH